MGLIALGIETERDGERERDRGTESERKRENERGSRNQHSKFPECLADSSARCVFTEGGNSELQLLQGTIVMSL